MEREDGTISETTRALMIGTAIFVDFLKAIFSLIASIPIFGWFIGYPLGLMTGIVAWFGFYLWFQINGIGFIDRLIGSTGKTLVSGGRVGRGRVALQFKKALSITLPILGTAIPIIPGYTVMAILTTSMFTKKAEDITIRSGVLTREDWNDIENLLRNDGLDFESLRNLVQTRSQVNIRRKQREVIHQGEEKVREKVAMYQRRGEDYVLKNIDTAEKRMLQLQNLSNREAARKARNIYRNAKEAERRFNTYTQNSIRPHQKVVA
jgi:hypothetical protein